MTWIERGTIAPTVSFQNLNRLREFCRLCAVDVIQNVIPKNFFARFHCGFQSVLAGILKCQWLWRLRNAAAIAFPPSQSAQTELRCMYLDIRCLPLCRRAEYFLCNWNVGLANMTAHSFCCVLRRFRRTLIDASRTSGGSLYMKKIEVSERCQLNLVVLNVPIARRFCFDHLSSV